MEPTGYITYVLIGISFVVTFLAWSQKWLLRYAMNREYISRNDYPNILKQVGLFQFIHGDVLHLVMNSYFLYSAGPILEEILGATNFLIFFLTTTLVTVFALYFLAPQSNTIGISNFCMALLSYLWIALYSSGSSWAGEVGVLLLINIAFGFLPGISLVGHAVGALWGILFWAVVTNIF